MQQEQCVCVCDVYVYARVLWVCVVVVMVEGRTRCERVPTVRWMRVGEVAPEHGITVTRS